MKQIKPFFLISLLFLVSCSLNANTSYSILNPYSQSESVLKKARKSFVFIEVAEIAEFCKISDKKEKICIQRFFLKAGSGVIVKNSDNGSFILTANHVRDSSKIENFSRSIIKQIKISDYQGNIYTEIEVVKFNSADDLCLLFVKKLNQPAVLFSNVAPNPGDRIFNASAPAGLYYRNMIPLFEGYFLGSKNKLDYYSFPLTHGSSGSMVLNKFGNLIGIITLKTTDGFTLTLGPKYFILKEFMKKKFKYR